MKGMQTIVKYSCVSDEQRWFADRYDMPWLEELSDSDKKIVDLLDCLPDGEFSGQASAVQIYELLFSERDSGYSQELIDDWGQILAYINIIVYEEMRHGLTLGKIINYSKTGSYDYFDGLSTREYSKKFVWCYEDRRFWDLYSFLLCHLFGEIINTELYRDIRAAIEHKELKNVITNIMRDEARHAVAWTALIKELVRAHPTHKERALKNIDTAILYHNAMSHSRFFEGQNKMLALFNSAKDEELGTLDRIVSKKISVLEEIFGAENPHDTKSLKKLHMSFLAATGCAKTARYNESHEYNLELD